MQIFIGWDNPTHQPPDRAEFSLISRNNQRRRQSVGLTRPPYKHFFRQPFIVIASDTRSPIGKINLSSFRQSTPCGVAVGWKAHPITEAFLF
ncbi:MAG: hypothetical protein IJM09_05910 [Neisseriaceae bacterium]|nr:hypothetical protein [Neisseriaceae bacterium]